MRLIIHDEAQIEIRDAARRYGASSLELEVDFLAKLEASIRDLLTDPMRFSLDPFSPRRKAVRMSILKRFPYKVLFLVEQDTLHLISVTHFRRDSRDWRRRV